MPGLFVEGAIFTFTFRGLGLLWCSILLAASTRPPVPVCNTVMAAVVETADAAAESTPAGESSVVRARVSVFVFFLVLLLYKRIRINM